MFLIYTKILFVYHQDREKHTSWPLVCQLLGTGWDRETLTKSGSAKVVFNCKSFSLSTSPLGFCTKLI